jgi:precorrin-3B synthase
LSILSSIADLGIAARARDLHLEKLTVESGQQDRPSSPCRDQGNMGQHKGSPLGLIELSNQGHALGIALPFGNMRAETLIALAKQATDLGASGIRPAPHRALLIMGLTSDKCIRLQAIAAGLGLVTDPADPRTRIAACPGAPACASGMIAARDVAAEIANAVGPDLDPTLSLHVSGCAKGCAHPGRAALTVVGDEKGAAFVVDATAKGLPATYTAGYEAARGVRILAALVAAERQPHEDATACLTRLGAARLSRAIAQG